MKGKYFIEESECTRTVRMGDVVLTLDTPALGHHSHMACISTELYGSQSTDPKVLPGIPTFRTRVLYVPQRPSLLPGTPRDFLNTISTFGARITKNGWFSKVKPNNDQSGPEGDSHGNGVAVPDLNGPIEVSKEWGIEEELWDRNWSELSGGEAQRIALATGVGLKNAEILLLDGRQNIDSTSSHSDSSCSLQNRHRRWTQAPLRQ